MGILLFEGVSHYPLVPDCANNFTLRPLRITGIKSGLKAAGQEFVFGIYDGFSGVITQPYTGARDSGPVGFVKGVAMGLTGFVLKDLSAIIGPFGYTLKGIHKEILKSKQPTNFIRRARILQGRRDKKQLDEDEKNKKRVEEEIRHGWSVVQQVWAIMEEKRAQGLNGRVKALRERRTWRANGAFENVEMAERAIEARRKGGNLEEVFADQKRELEEAKRPRRNVVMDLEKKKNGEGDKLNDDRETQLV